jgi:hypothetical protein
MARWNFVGPSFTPTQFADTTNITDNLHLSIQGGSATQFVDILECFLGGQATASAVAITLLSRHIVVGTGSLTLGVSGSSVEPYHPGTADLALPVLPYTAAATNKPQTGPNVKLINLSFNAFGGLVRKTWNPGEGPSILGNTQPLGELGISAFTGTAAGCVMGGHIEFEPK